MTEISTPTGEGLVDESAVHLDSPAPVSALYRTYALWLLMLIYVVSFLDRQVINILAEPIKQELNLADWQLGLLSGFAFGIVYTVLGFPLARAADRYNRPWIIAGCLTAWSGFTILCGQAQNFLMLVLARGGVGVGEAGCTPTSHALIADYTPREKRASALAFYAMGTPIGSLMGLALGGFLADTSAGGSPSWWRAAGPGLRAARRAHAEGAARPGEEGRQLGGRRRRHLHPDLPLPLRQARLLVAGLWRRPAGLARLRHRALPAVVSSTACTAPRSPTSPPLRHEEPDLRRHRARRHHGVGGAFGSCLAARSPTAWARATCGSSARCRRWR
jgi:MFS family permease